MGNIGICVYHCILHMMMSAVNIRQVDNDRTSMHFYGFQSWWHLLEDNQHFHIWKTIIQYKTPEPEKGIFQHQPLMRQSQQKSSAFLVCWNV